MSINRYAARVDANQAAIVDALRKAGATVWVIGLPVDLLVGYRSATLLMEVKQITGKREPKAKPHTKLQKEFFLDWQGGPVCTVTDPEMALVCIGAMKSREANA